MRSTKSTRLKKAIQLSALVLLLTVTACQHKPVSPSAFVPTGEPMYTFDYSRPWGDMCIPRSETFADFYCQGDEVFLVNTGHTGIAGYSFLPPPLAHLKNFMLQAKIRSVGNLGSYGVMFRENTDVNATYILQVRATGDFRVMLWSGIAANKELVPWTSSAAIHKGSALNLLQVIGRGTHFILLANGQELASLDDDTLADGWTGVVAMDGGHAAVKSVSIWKLP